MGKNGDVRRHRHARPFQSEHQWHYQIVVRDEHGIRAVRTIEQELHDSLTADGANMKCAQLVFGQTARKQTLFCGEQFLLMR